MNKDNITALIDADSIIWIIAYHHRDNTDSLGVVKHVDEYIADMLNRVHATQYAGFVGGDEKNFRYEIATHKPYKGNRPPKPAFIEKWEGIIKLHMIKKWGFVECGKVEADDAVSICAANLPETHNPIICHIDKDLNQIPGNHFNYQKKQFYKVSTEEAWRTMLTLVLTGDGTDNIAGLPGIGPAKAAGFLKSKSYEECREAIRQGFIKYYAEYYGNLIFFETLKLVRTLTEESYGFTIPEYNVWMTQQDVEGADIANIDFSLFE